MQQTRLPGNRKSYAGCCVELPVPLVSAGPPVLPPARAWLLHCGVAVGLPVLALAPDVVYTRRKAELCRPSQYDLSELVRATGAFGLLSVSGFLPVCAQLLVEADRFQAAATRRRLSDSANCRQMNGLPSPLDV